jgi:renalase
MLKHKQASVAVVGAGMAGAVCAQVLRHAGHRVQVFDKARGPGGRLATRRLEWLQEDGSPARARVDHGALAFTAHTAGFQQWVMQAEANGLVAPWSPPLADHSLPLEHKGPLYVATPEMTALCKHLLEGVDSHWTMAINRLTRVDDGWHLEAGDQVHPDRFDAVVLAIPPAQAAALLNDHRDDWARYASLVPMQPCWTLMGVAPVDATSPENNWALARPELGPLAWVIRNDRRPGRTADPGVAHWVVHARAGWSRLHLEQEPDWVKHQLSTALEVYLGHAVPWAHAVVHRWRYALPPMGRTGTSQAALHWWDDRLGLGVCGDLFTSHGVEGVEAAFLSAQSLAQAMGGPDAAAVVRYGSPAIHA